jgi:hypothetical protein
MARARALLFALPLASAAIAFSLPARADVAACIASSEQALSLRQQGKLHDALQQLALCADPGCPAEVASDCAQRISAVNAAMPTLILAARDGGGNDRVDVKVTVDGAPIATKLDGRPLSLDPGEHAFHFEVAGQPPLDKQLVLREGEKERRETVVIGSPPPLPPPPPPAAPPPGFWTTQRTLAIISGGVGIVGLGLGGVFGGLALSDQSSEKSNCSSSGCSNRPQAQADYNTGNDNATGSTIAFIAGGVFLAAGAVLYFTAHDATSSPTTGRLYLSPSTTGTGPGFVLGGEL